MFKNYFYLYRCAKELSAKVIGKKIFEIYTQEKDILLLHIPSILIDTSHIFISTNAQNPFINFKEHHKAKKNTKNFFEEFLPDTLVGIQIALGDRIVKFNFMHSAIYFIIRGAKSNVCLIDEKSNIHFFKKVDDKKQVELKSELESLTFIDDLEPVFNLFYGKSKDDILKQFRFVDKQIVREVNGRSGDWNSNLIDVINEIVYSEIAVYFHNDFIKPVFIPSTFSNGSSKEKYSEFFPALNRYFSLFYSMNKEQLVKNELEKFIEKDLEKISNKLNNLKVRIEAGSKEEEYYKIGNLLLINIASLRKGMKEISLNDGIVDSQKKIVLDEKISPQQNIDNYFDKARSEKINYKKSKELYEQYEREYKKLQVIKKNLENAITLDELQLIKKDLKLKMDTQKHGDDKDKQFNFRHFIIEGKYHVFVGKDSKNNDLLTTKFAKQNDLWFHARAVSGSHAVLRIENTKEPVPKNIIKKAASIAAYYSKSKTSKLAPVSYTFKKYVVKKKDLAPGQVILLKEDVLLVQPLIPSGCEAIDD